MTGCPQRTGWSDDFDGPSLDESVWLPHYLPAWSSRSATAASWRLANSCLLLDIPRDHPVWCADDHSPPLRVCGIQSGNFSGPAGSNAGQQPFRDGLTVREEQPRFEGLLLTGGHLEIRCRMDISARSMAALWLAGFEDEPERCGEICVVEIFGKSVLAGESAEVGMGVHAFRDPELTEDWAAPRVPIDVVGVPHLRRGLGCRARGLLGRRSSGPHAARPPTYPMQLMLAVFDFPEWSSGSDADLVPSLTVDWILFRPARTP